MAEPRPVGPQLDETKPQDPPPDAEPGTAARANDIDGLLIFLTWMQAHASALKLSPRTVQNAKATWRLAMQRLDLPGTTAIDDLDLASLAEGVVTDGRYRGRDPENTKQFYAGQLAKGRAWHQRWRAGEPNWMESLYSRNPVAATINGYTLPLSDKRRVVVKLPANLSAAEMDVLCSWLRTLTVNQSASADTPSHGGTTGQ